MLFIEKESGHFTIINDVNFCDTDLELVKTNKEEYFFQDWKLGKGSLYYPSFEAAEKAYDNGDIKWMLPDGPYRSTGELDIESFIYFNPSIYL